MKYADLCSQNCRVGESALGAAFDLGLPPVFAHRSVPRLSMTPNIEGGGRKRMPHRDHRLHRERFRPPCRRECPGRDKSPIARRFNGGAGIEKNVPSRRDVRGGGRLQTANVPPGRTNTVSRNPGINSRAIGGSPCRDKQSMSPGLQFRLHWSKYFGVCIVAGLIIAIINLFFLLPALARENAEMEELDVSLGELLNLEVTIATKTAVAVEDAPSIVSVITGDEIRTMGAKTIADVLRTVPGFDLTQRYSSTNCHVPYIRGLTSSGVADKIKVMMNGHSMIFLFGEAWYHFDKVPADNIDHLEIIRGPGSALYGTGAFLGVINIVTKKGGDAPSSIAASGGSYNTFNHHVRFSREKEGLKIFIHGETFNTEGHEGHIESDLFGSGANSAAPGDMTTDLKHRTLQTEINFEDFYFSGYFQKIETEVPVGVVALTDEDHAEFMSYFTEIGYKTQLTDAGCLNFRAFKDHGHHKALVEIFSEETSANIFGWDRGNGKFEESMFGRPEFKYAVTGGEATGEYALWDGIQTVAGFSYEKFEVFDPEIHSNANMVGRPIELNGVTYQPRQYLDGFVDRSAYNWLEEGKRTVTAVFGQGMVDVKKMFGMNKGVETLSLTMGVRYDDYDDVGSTANPRVGIVYAPMKKIYFKALYGTAFRAPSFNDMNVKNNVQIDGNKDLDPETIATMEGLVGINFTENIKSSITFFNIEAEDLIQPYRPPEGKTYMENVGSMESRGCEVELKMFLDRHKYAYFNLTYQDVRNTTNSLIEGSPGYAQENFNPGGIPEIIANIGANFDINKYVNANMWINYVGEKARTEEKRWDGEKLVLIDDRDPVDERYLANASFTFKNFVKGMEIQLSGYNLLDDDHREPVPVGSGIENDLPQPGRSFMAKISYSF